jgi:branched-chain amino acid transport system substrate-binding protein
VKNGAVQNIGGKLVTLAPKDAANAKPEWPLPSYQNRG